MLPTCVFKVDWLVSPPVKKHRLSLQLGDTNRRTQSVIDPDSVSSVQKRRDNTGRGYKDRKEMYFFIFKTRFYTK